MQVADAFVRMVVDEKELERSISSASGGATQAAEKGGAASGAGFTKSFASKATSGLKAAGSGILAGVGLGVGLGVAGLAAEAGTAIVAGLGRSVTAASDLAETVSKVGVVFGKESPKILAWGENAATALGQSKQQALEAAGTFGNLFVSMGLGETKAGDMSTSIVELASDLASFNNSSPEEALDALRSGLVGETEPLRRFGVNLNEATLKQKALDMGLIDSTEGTLPAAVKAQASYALILEQTKTAQGDFARTSGGLANQQRIATAKIDDAFARIGKSLAPLAAKVVPLLADVFATLAEVLGTIFDAAAPIIDLFIGLVKVLLPVGKLIFDVLIIPMKVAGQVIGGIVDFFKDAIRNIADFAAGIPGPWQDAARSVRDAIDNMDAEATATAAGAAGEIPGMVAGELAAGEGTVAGGADAMMGGVPGAVGDAGTVAAAEAGEIPGKMADGIEGQRDAIDSAFKALKTGIKNALSPAKEEAHLQGILASKRLAKGLRSNDPAVRARAQELKELVVARLSELRGEAQTVGAKAGTNLAKGLESKKAPVRTSAQELKASVTGPLTGIGKDSRAWGANAGQAYAAGLASTRAAVRNAARQVAQSAVSIFRATSPPGPDSPLHRIDEWGERTGSTFGESIAAGVSGSRGAIVSALGGLVRAGDAPRFPSFAVGTSFVPQDALALVHRGEIILPAEESDAIRRGRASLGNVTPGGIPKGGDTFNINVPIEGLVRARDPFEVVTQLQRMAEFGVLVPIRPEPS